jgi:hypothetical protein
LVVVVALLLGVVACNHEPTPDTESFGTISVQRTNAYQTAGSQLFSASLFPLHAIPGPCDGAALSIGACCYFAPSPVPVPSPGLLPGETADGGPDFVMAKAGALTLVDVTTDQSLAVDDYQPMVAGFGYSEGYPSRRLCLRTESHVQLEAGSQFPNHDSGDIRRQCRANRRGS